MRDALSFSVLPVEKHTTIDENAICTNSISATKIAANGRAAAPQRGAIRGSGGVATSEQKRRGVHAALLATRPTPYGKKIGSGKSSGKIRVVFYVDEGETALIQEKMAAVTICQSLRYGC